MSHGTLVCLRCAGRHRTLGVHVSRIKSLTMDAWEPQHVAAMLLSGNAQVKGFFKRQHVHNSPIEDLYPRVRAAEYYRAELAKQVTTSRRKTKEATGTMHSSASAYVCWCSCAPRLGCLSVNRWRWRWAIWAQACLACSTRWLRQCT